MQFVLNKKCTVKIIEVKAGEELSLQRHKKRVEEWYFLTSGEIQLGTKKKRISKGELIKIKKGQSHRLIAGKKPVQILEISLGNFSEKDEERLEDKYGRR